MEAISFFKAPTHNNKEEIAVSKLVFGGQKDKFHNKAIWWLEI